MIPVNGQISYLGGDKKFHCRKCELTFDKTNDRNRSFFREIRNKRHERDRIACISLGFACLILAEDRYSVETHSLQECIEQKSAVSEIIRTPDDLINFTALTAEFIDIRKQLRDQTADLLGTTLSSSDDRPAPKELTS